MGGIRFSNTGFLKKVSATLDNEFLNTNGASSVLLTSPSRCFIIPVNCSVYLSMPFNKDALFGSVGDRLNFQISSGGDPFTFLSLDGLSVLVPVDNIAGLGPFNLTPEAAFLYNLGSPDNQLQIQMVNLSGGIVDPGSYAVATVVYYVLPAL